MSVPLRTGVDLIEIARLQGAITRHGQRFLDRVFTPNEQAQAGHSLASLAARFAAKEAVAKAFCTGIGAMNFTDIEILRGPNGEPTLHFHGKARRLASQQNLTIWSISLSHTHTHAIALVVAIG